MTGDLTGVQRALLCQPRGRSVAHLIVCIPDHATPVRGTDPRYPKHDGQTARDFVDALVPASGKCSLAFGPERDSTKFELSLGFSFAGLQRVDLPPGYLRVLHRLAPAFTEGAVPRAAARLGDNGSSSVECWDERFAASVAHLVLTIHGPDKDSVHDCAHHWLIEAQKRGLKCCWPPLTGSELRDAEDRPIVHFGYRDGLSRVVVRGFPRPRHWSGLEHAQGAVLLGEPNDQGANPWLLGPEGRPARVRSFFRHASFGVLRVIRQDVKAFDAAVERWAKQVRCQFGDHPRHAGNEEEVAEQERRAQHWQNYVRAKLCGRWPDGRLFDPALGNQPSDAVPQQDFDHLRDPHGYGCPLASHIRRMNPRTTPVDGRHAERAPVLGNAVHAGARPLIRRGLPYTQHDGKGSPEHGLLGWFFCADIERQFEHLLGEWGDRPPLGLVGAGSGKDPLIGAHEDPRAGFLIPVRNDAGQDMGPLRLDHFARFCDTRGTVYALYPTREALMRMVRQDYELKDDPTDDDYQGP